MGGISFRHAAPTGTISAACPANRAGIPSPAAERRRQLVPLSGIARKIASTSLSGKVLPMMKFELPAPAHPAHPFGGFEAQASASIAAVVSTGASLYDRGRHLPRLIPLMPGEIDDARPTVRRAILARLARALRAERNRGRAGHWTYDLNRHIALKQAYAAERALLPK